MTRLNSTIEDDHPEIRDGVRQLCQDFAGAYWRDLDARSEYPKAFVAALTDAGYLAALVPERFGGTGLPLSAAAAILEEVHRSGGNAAACHAQLYMMGAILRHGSAAQKDRYLPGIAAGEISLQAFGVTEADSGSDTAALKTRAVKDGKGWVISGRKLWTSRAAQSDLMLVIARTSPPTENKRHQGLSLFLLDLREVKGVTIDPVATMMNHATTQVFLDDVRAPADALIGEEGEGFRCLLSGLNAERILIAAECIGDARWFLDKGAAYAKERIVFGRPIGQNQGVQFPLADSLAQTEAAALMVRHAASLYEAGAHAKTQGAAANMAKHLASEAAWAAADRCLQVHGGFGFARDFDVERKFRETRLYRVAPISTNMILAYLAETILGLPKSY